MTFFSIAIPVFGQQKYIPTALKSIQAQNVEYELAVMDATYDNSVQVILDQYSDIITYRRHGPDGGQSEAIIEGWDNTNGEVLAWLCADDFWTVYDSNCITISITINSIDRRKINLLRIFRCCSEEQ